VNPLDLGIAFSAGLLGSVHCVGMCGGLVAVVCAGGDGRSVHSRQVRYFLGKTLVYAALGGIAGAAGQAAGLALVGLSGVLSLALGIALVVAGVFACAGRRGGAVGPGAARLVGPLLGRAVAARGAFAPVALGAVNGLLPCGLVYGLLAKAAATGSAPAGAATLAVFGLATIPALYVVGLSGARIAPAWRDRMGRAAGIALVLLGLLTTARGADALAHFDAPARHQHDVLAGHPSEH
jgi:sulfite exporter TauE/SafE